MKISLNWLQCYFDKPLPPSEEIARLLTFGLCEVEGVEKIMGTGKNVDGTVGQSTDTPSDTVFDIKVLPDRACYTLSHRGVALEISALSSIPMKPIQKPPYEVLSSRVVSVRNLEPKLCTRYVTRYIENVTVGKTPDWPKLWLEAVGQRSINTVVDATNTVMLDMGQPLHAFDADKVVGGITVRLAKGGEKITTLDGSKTVDRETGAIVTGKEIELTPDMLVIADDAGPLAIAGVKGGNRAAVSEATKNLILESACFNPVSVRKTSAKVGIHNESSKRFENNVTPHLAPDAMDWLTALILEQSKEAKAGKVVDLCGDVQDAVDNLPKQVSVDVSVKQINSILGVEIPAETMIELLGRISVKATLVGRGESADTITVTVPHNRLDLRITADIAEEVGRLNGYDKIPAPVPPKRSLDAVSKTFYYSEKIKNILCSEGLSEVYGYTLVPKGDYEVMKPLASDKGALRMDLASGLSKSLSMNVLNADLLGLDTVCIFEIGSIFTKERESISLGIACEQVKKVKGKKGKDLLASVVAVLEQGLGISLAKYSVVPATVTPASVAATTAVTAVAEFSLTDIISALPDPTSYADLIFTKAPSLKYQPFSVYPFIVRDVAVFVPELSTPEKIEQIGQIGKIGQDEVFSVIENSLGKTGGDKLLTRKALFDVFTKKSDDGVTKTSYAFRLVFQAKDRTLSDTEIAVVMDVVYADLKAQEWEIR